MDSLTLPGEPASVGRARRFVSDTLASAGRADWVEAASLAVSELVTNSVLHAHSDVEITVRVREDHVRIEVRDRSPHLPVPRSYEETATTGRGLELVASVSFDHGVDPLADGKVVWCCVNSEVSASGGYAADFAADDWGDLIEAAGARGADDDDPAVMTVRLLGLPSTLWLAAREHHDALLREMALLQGSTSSSVRSEIRGDLAAADAARTRIGDAVVAGIEIARRMGTATVPLPAHHPGELPAVPATVDLELHVRRADVEIFAQMQDTLDEGEQLARADKLLVRPGLPEIIAVRDWACEQVIAQVGGTPPARWHATEDDTLDERYETDATAGWSTDQVTRADHGAIAVDESNRIVAISPPLARLVGWTPENLVGRRVVAIIPLRYREAHVAGFSRHLSTGEARALNVPLRLPVLCADGREVECSFLIGTDRTPAGRTIYVARIEPLSDDVDTAAPAPAPAPAPPR